MSNNAIIRVAKLKTTRDLFAVYGHHFRTEPFQENESLVERIYSKGKKALGLSKWELGRKSYDPDLEHLNDYEGGYKKHMKALHEINSERIEMGKLPLKDDKSKNAPNKGVEFYISLGEDAQKNMTRDELDAYFKDSVEFLRDKYKDLEIMGIAKHFDEPNALPHMHVVCMPTRTRTKKGLPSISVDKMQLNPKSISLQWKQLALFHNKKGRDYVGTAGLGDNNKNYLKLKELKIKTAKALTLYKNLAAKYRNLKSKYLTLKTEKEKLEKTNTELRPAFKELFNAYNNLSLDIEPAAAPLRDKIDKLSEKDMPAIKELLSATAIASDAFSAADQRTQNKEVENEQRRV